MGILSRRHQIRSLCGIGMFVLNAAGCRLDNAVADGLEGGVSNAVAETVTTVILRLLGIG